MVFLVFKMSVYLDIQADILLSFKNLHHRKWVRFLMVLFILLEINKDS